MTLTRHVLQYGIHRRKDALSPRVVDTQLSSSIKELITKTNRSIKRFKKKNFSQDLTYSWFNEVVFLL